MLEILLQEKKMQSNLVKTEIIEGEVIDDNIQNLEPMTVTATIQFVVSPVDNIPLQVEQLMVSFADSIITAIEQHKHKKVIPTQKFANTEHAAAYLDVDESFLNKRKGKTFKLGKHFYKPTGQTIVRWDLEALSEWMMAENDETFIDDELAALLERS
jgi:hypothetical protein